MMLVVVSVAVVSAQSWYELYDQAREDIRNGRWEQAEQKLLKAKQAHPRSGPREFRYGSLRDHFFPDYFLAQIYLNRGDAQRALDHLNAARKAGLDEQDATFRQAKDIETQARNALTKVVAAVTTTVPQRGNPTPPAGTPGVTGTPAANTGTPAAGVTPPVGTPTGATASASTPTTTIPPTLGTPPGGTPPGRGGTPAVIATPPANTEATTIANARQQIGDLLKRARTQLDDRDYTGAEQNASTARDIANRQNFAAERVQAENLLTVIRGMRIARTVEDALSRRDPRAARSGLDALVREVPGYTSAPLRSRVEQLEREVTADLERGAMVQFLTGNYQQTLTMLTQAAAVTRLSPRGLFYRACTLAALTETTPSRAEDSRRLDEAQRTYKEAARSAREFQRDLQYISPKIRAKLGLATR
jgi:tetratricopeptide (TPR) repeat protein